MVGLGIVARNVGLGLGFETLGIDDGGVLDWDFVNC